VFTEKVTAPKWTTLVFVLSYHRSFPILHTVITSSSEYSWMQSRYKCAQKKLYYGIIF